MTLATAGITVVIAAAAAAAAAVVVVVALVIVVGGGGAAASGVAARVGTDTDDDVRAVERRAWAAGIHGDGCVGAATAVSGRLRAAGFE